jgi:chromosomal replication initiator protein
MSTSVTPSIIERAATIFGVTAAQIRGPHKTRPVVRARHAAILVARQQTGDSLPVLGCHFGQRHHTTVLASLRRAEQLRTHDRKFRERLFELAYGNVGWDANGSPVVEAA